MRDDSKDILTEAGQWMEVKGFCFLSDFQDACCANHMTLSSQHVPKLYLLPSGFFVRQPVFLTILQQATVM